jgi:hypothetical protein
MSSPDTLMTALAPLLRTLHGADPDDPTLGTRLNQAHPMSSDEVAAVRSAVLSGLKDGWLCPKEAGSIRFGRLAKATAATCGFSIDAVDMASPGPGHEHPNGEIDLCFALEGRPLFDGQPEGWTVYARKSWHVPTVTGGRMAILYFLPGGKIRFGPRIPPTQTLR